MAHLNPIHTASLESVIHHQAGTSENLSWLGFIAGNNPSFLQNDLFQIQASLLLQKTPVARCRAFWLFAAHFNWASFQSLTYAVHCGGDKRKIWFTLRDDFIRKLEISLEVLMRVYPEHNYTQIFSSFMHSWDISFLLHLFLYSFLKFHYFLTFWWYFIFLDS